MRKPTPVDLLMVDDDPGDLRIAEEAFKEAGLPVRLHSATDGEQALQMLRRQGKFASAVRPNLVLLDLNMPRKGGLEVLREIKQDAALRDVPVVVLTTSDSAAEVRQAYALGANCYVSKPVDLDRFMAVLRAIAEFWTTVARLPPEA